MATQKNTDDDDWCHHDETVPPSQCGSVCYNVYRGTSRSGIGVAIPPKIDVRFFW